MNLKIGEEVFYLDFFEKDSYPHINQGIITSLDGIDMWDLVLVNGYEVCKRNIYHTANEATNGLERALDAYAVQCDVKAARARERASWLRKVREEIKTLVSNV